MANDIFPGAGLVQLVEWGYPMGSLRPTPGPAVAYSVIHITANLATAQAEAAWRKNDAGLQNSASFFVNQDGSVIQTLGDPLHMDPWTNGIFNNPDLSSPRIAAARAAGVNPNERSLITIENVGREPGSPITEAQKLTNARLIQYYHGKAGLAINRQTVLGHYQFDTVNRPNCPSTNKAIIDQIVALATGAPIPDTGGGDDVKYTEVTYPWPRDWTAKGGATHGFKYSPEPNTVVTLAAGSPARSYAEVTIDPMPDGGWLPGPYQQVLDGALAGYLVANSQLNLGPRPAPLPGPPAPAPSDCAAVEAELASTKEDLADANAALAGANANLNTLKQAVKTHVETVTKPETDLLKTTV